MGFPKVERLLINYKTLDEFKNLKGAGPRTIYAGRIASKHY